MNTRNHSRSKAGSIWLPVIICTFFGVAILYVLSIGPVAMLLRQGLLPKASMPILRSFYMPLELLGNYIPLVRDLFEWYMELCGG